MTILEMQESGRIQVLYNKWWKNTGVCGRIQVLYNKWWKNTGVCVSDDKKKESKASSLGVANVGGIFVVLFVGLALAVIVAALEFVWNNRHQTSVNRLNKQVSGELSRTEALQRQIIFSLLIVFCFCDFASHKGSETPGNCRNP